MDCIHRPTCFKSSGPGCNGLTIIDLSELSVVTAIGDESPFRCTGFVEVTVIIESSISNKVDEIECFN